jgi:hypothetical protein
MSVSCLVVAIWCLALSGCGSDNAYRTVKRSGSIKYDDGSLIPATRIELKFYSQAERISAKTGPKWGVAEVDVADGTFSIINTYDYDDGIIPGKHKVVAMAMNERNIPTDAIPKKCHVSSTTDIEIDTEDGDINIVIPKP